MLQRYRNLTATSIHLDLSPPPLHSLTPTQLDGYKSEFSIIPNTPNNTLIFDATIYQTPLRASSSVYNVNNIRITLIKGGRGANSY